MKLNQTQVIPPRVLVGLDRILWDDNLTFVFNESKNIIGMTTSYLVVYYYTIGDRFLCGNKC